MSDDAAHARNRRAAHEAGHAVLDLVCGAGVKVCHIHEDESNSGGYTERLDSKLPDRDFAYILIAGRASEELSHVESGDLMHGEGSSSDLESLANLLVRAGIEVPIFDGASFTDDFAELARGLVAECRAILSDPDLAMTRRMILGKLIRDHELGQATLDALNKAFPVGTSRLDSYLS